MKASQVYEIRLRMAMLHCEGAAELGMSDEFRFSEMHRLADDVDLRERMVGEWRERIKKIDDIKLVKALLTKILREKK